MAEKKSTSPGPHGASITIAEKKSTSPGPHGASRKTMQFHKLQKFVKFKGVTTEMAEERKGEPARKAGGQRMHAWSEPMTKEQKAQELTRKMKKGYRKGYRVGKRPAARKSSGR